MNGATRVPGSLPSSETRLISAGSYAATSPTTTPHQSLDNNSPQPRMVEPPPRGRIIAIPQVGGLHHRYQRAA